MLSDSPGPGGKAFENAPPTQEQEVAHTLPAGLEIFSPGKALADIENSRLRNLAVKVCRSFFFNLEGAHLFVALFGANLPHFGLLFGKTYIYGFHTLQFTNLAEK